VQERSADIFRCRSGHCVVYSTIDPYQTRPCIRDTNGVSCGSQGCDALDGWYDTGENKWQPLTSEPCKEEKRVKQEYRNYSSCTRLCQSGICQECCSGSYSVEGVRWQSTGEIRNLPDGSMCDDKNPDTVNDSCRAGECVGVSLSEFQGERIKHMLPDVSEEIIKKKE